MIKYIDHNLIIVNGIKNKALYLSLLVKGNPVIDYIICEENLLHQIKIFKTWHEIF
jgi:hypothetical protein